MSNENQPPVHRIRMGRMNVSIFANESELGKTFHNAQFDRAYLDGETWKNTRSFGRDDLLVLAKLADMAHTWICDQQQAASSQDEAAPKASHG